MDEERVPVLVGCGRHTERIKSVERAPNPLELMRTAVAKAAADLEIGEGAAEVLLKEAGSYSTCNIGPVGVPAMFGGDGQFHKIYPNPPLTLARSYGASPPDRFLFGSFGSGHAPQLTINVIADLIGRGELTKPAVIAGSDFTNLLKKAAAAKYKVKPPGAIVRDGDKVLDWGDPQKSKPKGPGSAAHQKLHSRDVPHELRHGLTIPANAYALFEQAFRQVLGRSTAEHMAAVAKLWSQFSEVAAEHPEHSWLPTRRSLEDIQEPSPQNRFVAYPYTKYHCSCVDVDQSAAIIMMSVAEARRRGIQEKKWVYLHGCAETIEKDMLTRPCLARSPAIRAMGNACFGDAKISLRDIRHFDIYSCFPSAVNIALHELEIPAEIARDGRNLTLTGGLPFHGGPGAGYVLHSVSAMMERLRENPGDFGFVTANGGVLSKHAGGIYSTTPYAATHPDATSWSRSDPEAIQKSLDSAPSVVVADGPSGSGRVEAHTVLHGKSGPSRAIVVGMLVDGPDAGKRFAALSSDPATLNILMRLDQLPLVNVHSDPGKKDAPSTFSIPEMSKL
eukprot:TRINITY_DN111390_c0_g1_i1.p1 TRINITY_DN111390_c0_g1~~TRINITY_DN111390_c0_g1_i1.p1  ORF type:complete len:561 (-),score=101.35 TRINITY_DN111390_c0_g1_i1:580-2262(-)